MVSVDREFRIGSGVQFLLGVACADAIACQPGLHSSEGLTGARGAISTVAPSHSWEIGAGCRLGTLPPFHMGFPTAPWSVLFTLSRCPRNQGGSCDLLYNLTLGVAHCHLCRTLLQRSAQAQGDGTHPTPWWKWVYVTLEEHVRWDVYWYDHPVNTICYSWGALK